MKKWASNLAGGALLSEKMKAERFNFGKEGYGFCVESIHYKSDIWIGHPVQFPGTIRKSGVILPKKSPKVSIQIPRMNGQLRHC